MQVVIDIPEHTFNHIHNGGSIGASLLIENAIKNGAPLPKGHGELKDTDAMINKLCTPEASESFGSITCAEILDFINDEKPIIKADKAMTYCKNYCEETEISTSQLNEAQRTLYYIAENMKMDKSISEEGYRHFQMAIKALEEEPILDKIRAEIEELQTYDGIYIDRAFDPDDVFEIIDKYRTEAGKEETPLEEHGDYE